MRAAADFVRGLAERDEVVRVARVSAFHKCGLSALMGMS